MFCVLICFASPKDSALAAAACELPPSNWRQCPALPLSLTTQLNNKLDESAQLALSAFAELASDSSAKTFIVCPAKGLTSPAKMERVGATCFLRWVVRALWRTGRPIVGSPFQWPTSGERKEDSLSSLHPRPDNAMLAPTKCTGGRPTLQYIVSSCFYFININDIIIKL